MLNIVCGTEIGVADWCLPVGVGAETRKKCLREKEQNEGDREQKGRDKEQFCSNFLITFSSISLIPDLIFQIEK